MTVLLEQSRLTINFSFLEAYSVRLPKAESWTVDQLRTLVTARKLLLEADDGWESYSESQTAEALAKLEALDGDLLGADFGAPEASLLALRILLIGDDEPNFADDFKNKLFERLRECHHAQLSKS